MQLYSKITDQILAELKRGVVPWRKDWAASVSTNIPHNIVSKRPYSGVNVILLWLTAQERNWQSLQFLTFKQAREVGGSVRGGEKSTGIVFVKQLQISDKKDPTVIRLVPMLRGYRVFHVSQCDGLPEALVNPMAARPPRNHDERDPVIDGFMATTKADIGKALAIRAIRRFMMRSPCRNSATSTLLAVSTVRPSMS